MARSAIFPFALWFDLAARSTQMMQASAEVMMRRTYGMARMGATPSVADQRELRLMVDEKVQASFESAMAMWLRAMRNSQTLMFQAFTGRIDAASLASMARTGSEIANAGLTPFHRRVRSNAKRLRK
ncbi:MAG: hypothetical protein ABW154_07300 [Dyella sp.]